MAYKHGVYGDRKPSNSVSQLSQGTVPVYIGSLPVQRIANGANYVNTPILINSYKEVNELGIYSDDWETFTLCEAIHAHFINTDNPTSPIVLINMLNPTEMKAAESTSATVTLKKEGTAYVGYINDPKCIIDELAITSSGSQLLKGGEVSCSYNGDSIKIKITKSGFNASSVEATYSTVAFSAADVTTEKMANALAALDTCEQTVRNVPNIIVAPQLSERAELHDMIVQKAIDKIANKWNVICVSDIPTSNKTIQEAIAWKKTNGYTNKLDKVCYPKVARNNKVYHLSVLTAAKMQYLDIENDDVPYVSPSNKVIAADSIVTDDGALYLNESQANVLNENGITTTNIIRGGIRLWGSHMANYNYENIDDIPIEERFDVCMRMSCYILNHLQLNYLDEVDTSISKKDIDALRNRAQTWLSSLVNAGMLLYANIEFDNDTDFANGDITFSIEVTYPVIAKSITFKLTYTSKGLSVLTEGGNA